MRLENVLALTHGSLKSQPHISDFSDIIIEAKRVKRGSLFIALNHYDIALALENGAYGIIYERAMIVPDDESAWIKVEDIYDALKRLMRFLLIDKELSAFTCKPIILQIAKQLSIANELIILEGSLSENFSKLLMAPLNSILLFSEKEMDSALFTTTQELPLVQESQIKILEQTLFESAFSYKDLYYERQLLSPFFLPYLEQLLSLLSSHHISFKIRPFMSMPHFQATFVNSSLHVKSFGTTNQVVIFESDPSLVHEQIRFINRQASWAKCICLCPTNENSELKDENIIRYKSENEALDILKATAFHFALVVGIEPSLLDQQDDYLVQQTLF
ncbi:MAG: hypothetical protein U9N52_09850 [Campylobacterota bacterium]|nr:hypothetical protein [Campylobacterota bacterium]